jgi:tetratricopeptide (TPR) repeat protein
MDLYRQAIMIDPNNPLVRMKLGILCRDREIWDEALEQFTRAASVEPGYGEAWREKGIVENKIAQSAKKAMDTDPAPGESSLRRAIELNNKDFDAFASLGGVLKRAKRFAQALVAYEQSYKLSGGHPYPLLNALKLRVQVKRSLTLSGSDKLALARAERIREGQSQQIPPFDKPWCFFDLAEIKLYRGDPVAFRDVAIKAWNRPMRIGREGLSLIVFGCYCRPLTNCLGLRKESLSWSRWCSNSGISLLRQLELDRSSYPPLPHRCAIYRVAIRRNVL